MFETIQMAFAVPNILLSVPLLAFIIAKIFFIERWLSSREGDFANHGSIATSQGLRHSALGARALCGSSGRRKAQKKHLSWGGQSGRSTREPHATTFTEPERHHGHSRAKEKTFLVGDNSGFSDVPH